MRTASSSFKFSEWGKLYRALLSFVGVAAFNIEDDDIRGRFYTEPDALCGLAHPLLPVQHVEVGPEESVEQRALAGALRADDGEYLVLLVIEPVRLLGECLQFLDPE